MLQENTYWYGVTVSGGLLGGINTYLYANGDPLRVVDAMGLMGGGGNHAPSELTKLSRQISECLCKLNPRFCINLKNIEGGTTGLGGVWPQIIGINPAGTTNVLGQTTISEKIFGGVPRKAKGFPEVLDLAETVAHESLHQTQESWFRRMGKENPAIDEEADAFIQANRQKVLDCLKNECGK